jgi:hypothetical protein
MVKLLTGGLVYVAASLMTYKAGVLLVARMTAAAQGWADHTSAYAAWSQ